MTSEDSKRICDVMWQMDISCGDIQMVREALEKQIPKKPIIKGDEDVWTQKCPCCDNYGITRADTYCVDCGQKLKWSNGND